MEQALLDGTRVADNLRNSAVDGVPLSDAASAEECKIDVLAFAYSNCPDASGQTLPRAMDYKTLTEYLKGTFPDELAAQIDVEQMFTLINSVLSIEICLHHQILPLFLNGSRLHLGMVFTDDAAAHDYIRRIVTYLNYSLVSQPISADALQTALSAYLRYNAVISSNVADEKKRSAHRTLVRRTAQGFQRRPPTIVDLPSTSAPASGVPPNQKTERRQVERRQVTRRRPPPPEAETYVVDSPTSIGDPDLPFPLKNTAAPHEETHATLRLDDTVQLPAHPEAPLQQPSAPRLALRIRRPELPFEQLGTLPPQDLLPELIGRALAGKISRLYFESQSEQGRILLSDSGVLRSAIDSMPKEQLQGVLNELKQIMQLPMISTSSANHAELEYIYGQSAVLLRIRITAGQHGESAMLQVLQGSALKFYQRQQVVHMGQEAIDAAKQLQLRISDLTSRMMASPHQSGPVDVILDDLSQLLKGVSDQVATLQKIDAPGSPETAAPD